MQLSVIVPVWNEAAEILDFLARLEEVLPKGTEILVCDGGSTDGTRELVARALRARHPSGARPAEPADRCAPPARRGTLLEAPRGRARQMNAGAARARGEALLFLHADTRLAPGAAEAVIRLLEEDPSVAGGVFSKVPFPEPRLLLLADRVVAGLQRRRPTLLGDRGVFVRRSAFEAVGGYRDLEVMEDPDLGWRLEGIGRLVEIGPPVTTSDRRFRRGGVLRTLLAMASIFVLFRLGVPSRWLARLYRPIR